MAMLDAISVPVNIGALSNAKRQLLLVPTIGGDITLLSAGVSQGGSTNSSLRLLVGTNTGGTFSATGTLDSAAIGGTATPFAANVMKSWTLSTTRVAAGSWLGIVEGNVAACNAVAIAHIEYVRGVS